MLRKRLLGMLAALTILLTGGLVAVTPSAAQAQPVGCTAGTFCLYLGDYYTGTVGIYSYSQYGGGGCHNLAWPFSSSTSSAYNDLGSGIQVNVYEGASCSGRVWYVYAKAGAYFTGTWMDNNAASIRFTS